MPSARNCIIGTQLYKYNIFGFLHRGYNFYNDQYSYAAVIPFLCSDGECFAPSGDTYSGYPGIEGQPWTSLRQVVFAEALQDIQALKLGKTMYGRDKVMEVLEEGIEPITFRKYLKDAEYLLNLRRRINAMIKEKVSE